LKSRIIPDLQIKKGFMRMGLFLWIPVLYM
jgi:hypothetical protein